MCQQALVKISRYLLWLRFTIKTPEGALEALIIQWLPLTMRNIHYGSGNELGVIPICINHSPVLQFIVMPMPPGNQLIIWNRLDPNRDRPWLFSLVPHLKYYGDFCHEMLQQHMCVHGWLIPNWPGWMDTLIYILLNNIERLLLYSGKPWDADLVTTFPPFEGFCDLWVLCWIMQHASGGEPPFVFPPTEGHSKGRKHR